MQAHYYKEYSRFLKRDMEFKVYGNSGQPCLVVPCEGGRFYDWENYGLVDSLAPMIKCGLIQLFCADSVDAESWQGCGDCRDRTVMQERWFNYICTELFPRILELNAASGYPHEKLLAMGISLGAGQAVSLYLRRPGLFCGAVGLSGSYLPDAWFGDYRDDLTLRNSPVELLLQLPSADISACTGPLWLCCGQGAYEERFLSETRRLADALNQQGVPFHMELWGYDCSHDWSWWYKQLPIFTDRALHEI